MLAPLAQAREQLVDEGEALGEARARRRRERADPEVLLDREAREQPAVLGHVGDAELDHLVRRHVVQRPPVHVDRAARHLDQLQITRKSVVLPALFGPITATASPPSTSSETSNSAWKVP